MFGIESPTEIFIIHWLEASIVVGIVFTLIGYFFASRYICKCNTRAKTLSHQRKQILEDIEESERFNQGIEHIIAELHKRK